MPAIRFACPLCDARLTLASAPSPGKKLKCPKCAASFEVPQPDTPSSSGGQASQRVKNASEPRRPAVRKPQGRIEETADDEGADTQRKQPSRTRRKKKPKKGRPVLFWGLIGGGVSLLIVGGIAALALSGFFTAKPVSPSPRPESMVTRTEPMATRTEPMATRTEPMATKTEPAPPPVIISQARAILTDHTNVISCLAITRDGKTFASGSHGGEIRLWETATAKAGHVLHPRMGNIQVVAFSPDGRTLAAGGDVDYRVHLWETDSGKELQPLQGLSNIIRNVAFSEDGKLLAGGSGVQVNRQIVKATGETIQLATIKEEIRLWEWATGAEKLTMNGKEQASLKALRFSAGDKTLLSINDMGDLNTWDIGSGRAVASARLQPGITATALTSDGKMVATGDNDGIVTVWEVAGGRQLHKLVSVKNRVASLAFSPDGKFLAVGTGKGMKPVEVRLWEVTTERARGVVQGLTGAISAVVFGPDGKTLVTGGWDKKVRVWDIGAALE